MSTLCSSNCGDYVVGSNLSSSLLFQWEEIYARISGLVRRLTCQPCWAPRLPAFIIFFRCCVALCSRFFSLLLQSGFIDAVGQDRFSALIPLLFIFFFTICHTLYMGRVGGDEIDDGEVCDNLFYIPWAHLCLRTRSTSEQSCAFAAGASPAVFRSCL